MLREGFTSILSLEKPGDPRQGLGLDVSDRLEDERL